MNPEESLKTQDNGDIYRLMDRFDEDQILAELQGQDILSDYFYEFTNKEGKLVVGLSWNGIKAFSHSMSRLGIPLSTEKVEFEDLGDRVRAKAYVRFMPTGEMHIGISHQNKKMEVWANKEKTEKKLVDDPYYDEKASSKAKRNGIRECIPEQVITAEYKRWKAQKQSGKWPEPPSAEAVANAVPRGKGKASESKPDRAQQTPSPNNTASLAPFDISKLDWYTKDEKGKNRKWQQNDSWGFANVEFSGQLVDLAKPVVAAIANNGGAIIQDGEVLSFEHGQLLRKRGEGTL